MPNEFCGLVDRCLAGEQGAILELVEQYQGQVFGLCLRMVRHRQDAEDLTQESLVRALRSLGHWDRERPFLPWLMTIAGNRCRTLLARRMTRPATTPLVEALPDTADDQEPARRLAEELQLALDRRAGGMPLGVFAVSSATDELCGDCGPFASSAGNGENVGSPCPA